MTDRDSITITRKPPHRTAAERLALAAQSVGMLSGIRDDLDSFGASTSVVISVPRDEQDPAAGMVPVHVLISTTEYTWHTPGADHAHQVSIDAPADDIAELIAVCLAAKCGDLDADASAEGDVSVDDGERAAA